MDLKTFFENFDTLAEAPGGIKRLRALILDMAVRGKLVQQDPEDEPAEEILNRIKKECVRKSRPRKQSEAIELPEQIEIPKKWSWTNLQELGTVNPRNNLKDELSVGFIPMRAISVDHRQEVEFEKRQWKSVRKGYTHFADGDVAIAKITPCFQNGKAVVFRDLPNGYGAGTTELLVFRPDKNTLVSEYILLFLKSKTFVDEGISRMTGTAGQQRVPRSYFAGCPLPLPPLAEQKRIVAKVDELMALCDRAEAAQQKRNTLRQNLRASALDALMNATSDTELETAWGFVQDNWMTLCGQVEDIEGLRQSILQIAVQGRLKSQNHNDEDISDFLKRVKIAKEDFIRNNNGKFQKTKKSIDEENKPFIIPETWAWLKINDSYHVSGGIQKTPERKPIKNYFPYLRVANVQRNTLDLEQIEYFELLDDELERWKLQNNDLLIVEGNGSAKEIGRCAVWQGEIKNCVHQNHIIRARPIGHDGQLFTLLFLNAPSGKAEMKRLAITTSGLYSLSVGKIREIVVPTPPPAEQKRIVAKVDELMQQCDHLETTLRKKQQIAEALVASATANLIA